MNQDDVPLKNRSEIKSLNRWLIALVVIIIIWAAGIIMYVDKRTSSSNHPLPIIMVDDNTGEIIDPAYTNLFNYSNINSQSNTIKPLFEHKDHYNVKDFVVVNYFYIGGIVIDRSGDEYTIMYKDHNKVLQKFTISGEFLLSPISQTSVSPVSLFID